MSNDELKRLQAKWYKKLSKTGFKDIESKVAGREVLNMWDSVYFHSTYTAEEFEAKRRYFELARHFLDSHVFENSLEKWIWSQHSEGFSSHDIAKKCTRKLIKGINVSRLRKDKLTRYRVNEVVNRLKREMLGKR